MQPCERSDKVPENKNSHVLFLAGGCWLSKWFCSLFVCSIKSSPMEIEGQMTTENLVDLKARCSTDVPLTALPPSSRSFPGMSRRFGACSPGPGRRRHHAGDRPQQRGDCGRRHPCLGGLKRSTRPFVSAPLHANLSFTWLLHSFKSKNGIIVYHADTIQRGCFTSSLFILSAAHVFFAVRIFFCQILNKFCLSKCVTHSDRFLQN